MLAKDTICAEMAFMLMERNRAGSTIDYPLQGSRGIVDALVRGIEKNGGRVMLRARVEDILLEGEPHTHNINAASKLLACRSTAAQPVQTAITHANFPGKGGAVPQGCAYLGSEKIVFDVECHRVREVRHGIERLESQPGGVVYTRVTACDDF